MLFRLHSIRKENIYYQPYFQKYYGISDYAGHLPQVEEMIEQINHHDFANLVDNLKKSISEKIGIE